ncbi:hypothetical protein [Thalassospira sp.]|uniref:hypothetical protein n=1 Tax=Thalassospira sp. TaxID=1912094 RepID=UPI00257EBD26|nr:hypothetical protein [Thalassospira sp.]
MAGIADRVNLSVDANTMIVTVITVGHAICAMPRRMAASSPARHGITAPAIG